MNLLPDWKKGLRRWWSLRLMALAALLTGCEAIITVGGVDWLPVPAWVRLLLVFVVIAAAFVARLLAQRNDP